MQKLKAAFLWLKQKWLAVTAFAVLLLAVLLARPNTKKLQKTFKNNLDLESDATDLVQEKDEELINNIVTSNEQTVKSLQKLEEEKKQKLKQLGDSKQELHNELSKLTNAELAERLKKDKKV